MLVKLTKIEIWQAANDLRGLELTPALSVLLKALDRTVPPVDFESLPRPVGEYSIHDLPPRLVKSLLVNEETGCWEWIKSRRSGYGQVKFDGKCRFVHRVAYALLVGEIPSTVHLDHLCRVRACANPAHLEPVTHRENMRRGDGVSGRNAKKTHCPKGHPYLEGNTYVSPRGNRQCKECRREHQRKREVKDRKRSKELKKLVRESAHITPTQRSSSIP